MCYLISLLACVFAVCGCQVSKVLSTMCCLFVLVLYVHYCRVVCSTNLCSPVLFSYFQIHVSFVVVFVIGQSVQVQVSRLKAFVPQRSLLLPERCLRSLLALRNLFPPAHSLFRYSVLKLLLALGNISLRFTHRSIISPKLEKFF